MDDMKNMTCGNKYFSSVYSKYINKMNNYNSSFTKDAFDNSILLFFSILITGKILGQTMFLIKWNDNYDSLLLYFFMFAAIIKFMTIPVKQKMEVITIAVYSFVLLFNYIYSGDSLCLYILFVTLSLRDIPVKKVIKIYFLTCISVVLCIIVANRLDIIVERLYHHGERRRRYSLGASYCTLMPGFWIGITYSMVALIREKVRWIHCIVLFVAMTLTWYIFDAKTRMICQGLLLIFVLLIKYVLNKKNEKLYNIISKIAMLLYPLNGLFMIVVSVFYSSKNKVLEYINLKLSGRLGLGLEAFLRYDIKFWGQPIHTSGTTSTLSNLGLGNEEYFFIDSSYIYMLLHFGVLMYILVLGIYIFQLMKAYEKKNFYIVAVLIMYSIVGMIEPELYWYNNNPFLFMLLCDWDNIGIMKDKTEIADG